MKDCTSLNDSVPKHVYNMVTECDFDAGYAIIDPQSHSYSGFRAHSGMLVWYGHEKEDKGGVSWVVIPSAMNSRKGSALSSPRCMHSLRRSSPVRTEEAVAFAQFVVEGTDVLL